MRPAVRVTAFQTRREALGAPAAPMAPARTAASATQVAATDDLGRGCSIEGAPPGRTRAWRAQRSLPCARTVTGQPWRDHIGRPAPFPGMPPWNTLAVSAPPEVSIVTVAYRSRDHVLACLESVRKNVSISHETIVVDDGSGDGTPEAVS